jgi:hypothetical protein
MILYTCYTLFFLFLLLRKKGVARAIYITENETKLILLGLVIYCASFLVSSSLIEFGLKNDSFHILTHHALLLAIGVVLYIKMTKVNDSRDK